MEQQQNNQPQLETPKPEQAVVQRNQTIAVSENGLLRPTNIEEAFRLANAFFKSGILPQRFKSAEMVLTAMQFVQELGLKPLTALRQMAVIQGTPSLFGDLPLSLAYASGKLESLREYLVDVEQREICAANGNLQADVWGAVCIVKRKGDDVPAEAHFTLGDAARAGLAKGTVWQAYPKRMLKYRARSQALKDKMPDCLNGIAIAEYDFDELPEVQKEPIAPPRLLSSSGDRATDLNAQFKKAPEPPKPTEIADDFEAFDRGED